MKTLLTIVSFLLVAQAFGQSKKESEFTALSTKRVDWLLAGKVDSLKTLYDDNSLTIHNNGMIKTAAEHLEDVKNGRPVYKSITIQKSTVKDFGTTAVLVGEGVFNIAMNGQDMNYNMVYTEVYLNKNNHWKLISRMAVQRAQN